MPKLTAKDRAAVSQSLRHTQAVKASRRLARVCKTVHPSAESMKRRKRLEPHLADWMKYYMGETFPDPWGPVHVHCLNRLQECIDHGGSFAFAMERGGGKSSIGKAATVYATITGRRCYPVPIGSTDELAAAYLDYIKQQLCGDNERLAEDYPECISFFKNLDGQAIRGPHQTDEKFRRTGISWRARGITFPTVYMPDGATKYPFSGARIECRGITAAMKGMAKTTGGKIIRPDFVLPDDVQTEDDAISGLACNKIENKIVGTVLALAGPRRRIACFMPCTCVEVSDVSSRFLDRVRHPEFQGERHPMFVTWPKAQDTLWREYAQIRKTADDDAIGKKAATEFYLLHRTEMDEGASVSWDSRIRTGEVSAIETAENLLFEYGQKKFFAEMQQAPIEEGAGDIPYHIDAPLVASRVSDRAPFAVPEWVDTIVASTDCNPSYALTSVAVGFGRDQTAAVLWYGLFTSAPLPIKNEMPQPEQDKLLFQALEIHGKQLAGLSCSPKVWAIDAGYNFETVTRFCPNAARLCGVPAMAFWGSGWKNYRHFSKTLKPGPQREMMGVHGDRGPNGNRREWVVWHADYWREIAQKAWLGSVGSPGSLSLFRGHHGEFAAQVAAEPIAKKGIGLSGKLEWIWKRGPQLHDYGDAMAQAYAGAGWGGIGTGGRAQRQQPRRKATGCTVIPL